jgi:hypothetical protein
MGGKEIILKFPFKKGLVFKRDFNKKLLRLRIIFKLSRNLIEKLKLNSLRS